MQSLQHHAAGLHRRLAGIEHGDALGDEIGVHKFSDAPRPLQKQRCGGSLPGAIRPGNDDDVRHAKVIISFSADESAAKTATMSG